jgi:hypothetical protein
MRMTLRLVTLGEVDLAFLASDEMGLPSDRQASLV